VSETGAAGPTGNRYGDPAGHAWVAVAANGNANSTIEAFHVLTDADDRAGNMIVFAAAALNLLLKRLREHQRTQSR